jgi:hypothetical protein
MEGIKAQFGHLEVERQREEGVADLDRIDPGFG